jgi:uncharacterized protein (DUF1015 family)
MAVIKPFEGIRYNSKKIADLSRVICPPYDVISPQRQQYFHQLNPHNFLHVLLPKDIPGEDKYILAGELFRKWITEEVLIREEQPVFYFYSHQYAIKGERRIRLGFIGLMELTKGSGAAYGHEHTRLEAKEDRLRIMRQVKANLSPIFIVFSDKQRIIQRIYQHHVLGKKPFIDIVDDQNCTHKLWRVDHPEAVSEIQSKMSQEEVFIADGHHRYEVACAFRDQMQQKSPAPEDPSFNYLMAYFTNTDARGLVILAIHRLVKLDTPIGSQNLSALLGDYFEIEELRDKTRLFFLLEKSGRSEHVFGVYANKIYWLLRLKNIKIIDKLIPDKPLELRLLDVSILNQIIFKKILGLNPDDKARISFNPSAEELISAVDLDPCKVAFFLNPVKVTQMMAVALGGNKMPPKSTYFYPKVASGLLVHKFKEL